MFKQPTSIFRSRILTKIKLIVHKKLSYDMGNE